MTKPTILFLVANEAQNAGERDYMLAIADAIHTNNHAGANYLICKVPTAQSDLAQSISELMGNVSCLPSTKSEYAAVPIINDDTAGLIAKRAEGPVDIVGVGYSTLPATLTLKRDLEKNGVAVQSVKYVTHQIDSTEALEAIISNKASVIGPFARSVLAGMNKKMVKNLDLVTLNSAPHTNTERLCRIEYDRFMKTENGATVAAMVEGNEQFAFAVVNAGFKMDNVHKPYTEEEAYKHGYALGTPSLHTGIAAGTHIILAHGGPRNIADEVECGQLTMNAFASGYLAAQAESGASPKVLWEPFRSGGHDMIKAGFILSHHDQCVAFISNAEGYGTMEGALKHVNNQTRFLGMIPFELQKSRATDGPNMEAYHMSGIARIVFNKEGRSIVERHPQEKKTPQDGISAAQEIVYRLKLAGKPPLALPTARGIMKRPPDESKN